MPRSDSYTCGQAYDHCFRIKQPASGNRCFEIVSYRDSGASSKSNPVVCSKPV